MLAVACLFRYHILLVGDDFEVWNLDFIMSSFWNNIFLSDDYHFICGYEV